jgi:hypothetical protein
MARDGENHCRPCQTCQQTKGVQPVRALMGNIPIGMPWEMMMLWKFLYQ